MEDVQVASTSAGLASEPLVHELEFTIVGASSYSNPYRPERILENDRHDPASRWSTEIKGPGKAWIVLELKKLSVLSTITFRKHYKPHPCNLHEFEVWTGASEDRLSLKFQGQLKDDDIDETVRFEPSGPGDFEYDLPMRFVKIVPLSAHMPKYNASIWNVVIEGWDDPVYVRKVSTSLQDSREREGMRLVMKFLRQRGLEHVNTNILNATKTVLEDPLVSRLYDTVVNRMDYGAAESVFREIGAKGGFASYLGSCSPRACWRRVESAAEPGKADAPCNRGGHTLCLDHGHHGRHIYLLGGWDGVRELPDFWSYDIQAERWRVLSLHTQADGGPGARVGHAMTYDRRTNSIFILGRYINTKQYHESGDNVEEPPSERFPSDFFRFKTAGHNRGTWEKLSLDTEAEGGPPLLHGHRMVVDSDSQRLYVFGGEIVTRQRNRLFAGLYCYDIAARTWKMIFDDKIRGGAILSRKDHSMLLDETAKTTYIFGGTRDGAQLSDAWVLDVPSGRETLLQDSLPTLGAIFGDCQRSILDKPSGEIRLFCCSHSSRHMPAVWRCTISSGSWEPLQVEAGDGSHASPLGKEVGHAIERSNPYQTSFDVVYDNDTKQHFLFGGDPGGGSNGLWVVSLESLVADEAVRRCQFLLRRHSFIELCHTTSDIQAALSFLRDTIGPTVNMSSTEETAAYHSLMEYILRSPEGDDDPDCADIEHPSRSSVPVYTHDEEEKDDIFRKRMQLFEQLLLFIEPSMRQPDDDLMDQLF
ncbi:hypothetical protein CALCODRAFT_552839 [Calocera cornea HHB12733]|uniref:F5/8 type C domain-containing protein n=1 Tax=Calocera cornea HHB12733 TaxID=1353952 RepID=A0A165JLX3_9BASI|nr:hypothetical protein CALCODRAFT_552839 [Calocera cornea HHB12733]